MAEALSNATAKFRDTMGELRGMTAQIQRELEDTRAELRRGVVELPQETQETTANMRRVVADQIKALNELSALVSRSNRVVDAAPAAQPRRVNEAPVAAIAAAVEQRRRRPAVAPAPMPVTRTGSDLRPPCRTEGSGTCSGSSIQNPAPCQRLPVRQAPSVIGAPAPRREDPRRPAAAAGCPISSTAPRARKRSSRDVAVLVVDRSRVNSLESLDSISVDIARMIDHDAAVELWDRYKRGESNVFTRRLYTLQGQQTFDEIRRKYRPRRRVQADRRPLRRGVRAPSRGSLPRRPGFHADEDLPDLGNRQGLHHAGPCERQAGLSAIRHQAPD